MRLLIICALSCIFAFTWSIHPVDAFQKDFKERIAIFPFENFSEDKNALARVMPVLTGALQAKGYEVLDEDSMNTILLRERIRTVGFISKELAAEIGKELEVKAILTGSVNSFSGGINPAVGFSARLINPEDGAIVWANHASATGEDFTKILDLGKIQSIDKLTLKIITQLLESFSTSPPDKIIESSYRIAVMPFQNESKTRDLGLMATYMFIVELFKSKKFMPLEYGEAKRFIIDLRIRDKGEIDLKNAMALSGLSGVDGVLVGAVEVYNEGSDISIPPEAGICARLINAHNGKILWYKGHQSKGDDDIIMLDWGRIRSPENVAYKAVARLVKEMEKVKWH